MNHELRFRQVHLDFHTSEHVPGVGSEFDPERFVATLKAAHVDSVTLFSRCHHGWIYHDTRFPNRHPNLTCNLLAEQIRACHAADIRCPIYITVGWDDYVARTHPEWLEIDEEGRRVGPSPSPLRPGWRNLDFASPYLDYVIEQTEEVLDLFGDEVDGFFFDIIFQRGVHSSWCLNRFAKLGWNPRDPQRQTAMRELLTVECTNRISAAVWGKNPNVTVFHNGGHVGPVFRRMLDNYSHLEVESLPTGGWGYMHFPITARYTRTLGKDFLGMTGKFSETWGHFNSYKPQAALEYECFSSLALGGKCSVGDQLHPTGVLDEATYDLIGSVYSQVEAREPWCKGARGVAEIAVMNAEEFDRSSERMDPRNLGAARMLMEGRHQFDFVDSEADLSGYKVLVLPDVVTIEGPLKDKVEAFIAIGGSVLATGRSGFGLSGFPSVPTGRDLAFSPDFVRTFLAGRQGTDYVMYERGVEVAAAEDAEVLATITEPYFERSFDRFVSHAHTPPAKVTDRPAATQKGRILHLAHPVFTTYALHSMPFHRDYTLAALRRLLPEPVVEVVGGPTSLQATLTALQDGRRVVHLLHYVSERRGLKLDVVEDRLPVYGLRVGVLGKWCANLQPQGTPCDVADHTHRTWIEVGCVDGHQMIELIPA